MEVYLVTISKRDVKKDVKNEENGKHTAAIDGIDMPGDPCDTSIPRMMVEALETTGIEGVLSIVNIEFNPPSWKIIQLATMTR